MLDELDLNALVVGEVSVTEDTFGKVGDAVIGRFTLTNGRVSVQVVSLGAAITSVYVPDRAGNTEDIALGFDTPQGYLSFDNPHFGSTVGRVANRLATAGFTLDNKEYKLFANEGRHTLHGGLKGWHMALWTPSKHPDGVTFTLHSPDGDEGFPGAVTAQVTYRLTMDGRLRIGMQAMSSKPTPVSMLNHAYFNLGGHASGAEGLNKTRIVINADRYTEVDQDLIPTGAMPPVEGTSLDLRTPRLFGDILQSFDFDHNFVVTRGTGRRDDVIYVAGAVHEPSGRSLEVYSDQPGLHMYSCGKTANLSGKNGVKYQKHAGFTLEPQYYPNAIHSVKRFPQIVLRPGSLYNYNMFYKFGVRKQ